MKVIGITGGIGSGKTTVCKILEAIGIPVFYADEEAKKLYSDPSVRSKVEEIFGSQIYTEGKINKALLAQIVFADPEKLKSLEAIIHPSLARVFDTWKSDQIHHPLVAKEAAILIESGGYKSCDEIILVTAPKEMRIQRVSNRDGVSANDVEKRMDAQMSDSEKSKYASFIIENDGSTLISKKIADWLDGFTSLQ